MQKSDYLDSFKGIAIIAVTLVHMGGTSLPGFLGIIGANGDKGVQLFFVISGLLAFTSLEHAFPQRSEMKVKNVFKWYMKKFLRIIPMFYLAVLISLLSHSESLTWLGNEGHVTWKNILSHIFLLHGFFPHYTDSILGIEWYVGVLVIFWLISPLIYLVIDSFEKSVLLILLAHILYPLANSGLSALLPMANDPEVYGTYITTFGPLAQIYVYCLGITLFFTIKKYDNRIDKKINNRLLSYTLLIFCVFMIYGSLIAKTTIFQLSNTDVLGIWFALAIFSQHIYSSKIIVNGFWRLFGKYSYGIYLFQYIWIFFYNKYLYGLWIFNRTIVKFILSLAVLLVISVLCTKFWDEPIQKFIKKM